MVIVDVNVLINAVHRQAPQHEAARAWLTRELGSGAAVGLPWVSLLGFMRIATNRRVFSAPLSKAQALDLVDAWLAAPGAWTPEPTGQHAATLRALLAGGNANGNLTADAHLASLALEHRASVATFDHDFLRFGVPVVTPEA